MDVRENGVKKRAREKGRVESTNKSSGETMLLKVANCLALLLPGTTGWAREAVFHSPELINDPRREEKKELTRHSTHSLKRFIAMDACGANALSSVFARSILSLDAHQCKLQNRESMETRVLFRLDNISTHFHI